jgi:hypothetical protein
MVAKQGKGAVAPSKTQGESTPSPEIREKDVSGVAHSDDGPSVA